VEEPITRSTCCEEYLAVVRRIPMDWKAALDFGKPKSSLSWIWPGNEIRVAYEIITSEIDHRNLIGKTPVEHFFEGHDAVVIKMLWPLWIPAESKPVEIPVGVPHVP